jgi:hypothetical protein
VAVIVGDSTTNVPAPEGCKTPDDSKEETAKFKVPSTPSGLTLRLLDQIH